jgi:hypothetical protein
MIFLRRSFESGLSSGSKPKIFDRAMMLLVCCSLLGGIFLEDVDFGCCFWWWFELQLREIDHCGGTFYSSFVLIWLCASIVSFGYWVGAEVKCIWYLHDISIFFL